MYKISLLFFVLFFTHFFGQKNLELKGVKDFLTDDYGNIYALKTKILVSQNMILWAIKSGR
jgi:hypothetical protein